MTNKADIKIIRNETAATSEEIINAVKALIDLWGITGFTAGQRSLHRSEDGEITMHSSPACGHEDIVVEITAR